MRLRRHFRNLQRAFYKHLWWFVLVGCLTALFFYGLAVLTTEPTVETITTPAPVSNGNRNQMREVDYQPPRKSRGR